MTPSRARAWRALAAEAIADATRRRNQTESNLADAEAELASLEGS